MVDTYIYDSKINQELKEKRKQGATKLQSRNDHITAASEQKGKLMGSKKLPNY